MLAGLLFATHDAQDRPGVLGATLPFGGLTLIEYQARLLARLGAAQIIVVVARLTPELLGAIARIGRRGIAVDAVRTAGEAVAKLHPLARVLMLADGLVTTEAALAPIAGEGADALLTLDAASASAGFERLGADAVWAGAARLSPARLAEVAAMPRDYDVESALVRVAAQAGAPALVLGDGGARDGHGIERSAAALDTRGRAVLAELLALRRGWFDRWIAAPLARPLLGEMMRRRVPTVALAALGGALALAGLAGLWFGHPAPGMMLALVGTIALAAGAAIAWLRDEDGFARGFAVAVAAIPALAALLLGRSIDAATGRSTGVLLAIVLVFLAALDARASAVPERWRAPAGIGIDWRGGPGACLLLAALPTLAGAPLAGLALATVYAAASLTAAIESLRRGLARS